MAAKAAHCRICGCTELKPCRNAEGETCFWVDLEKTLCSNVDCIEAIPLSELEKMELQEFITLFCS